MAYYYHYCANGNNPHTCDEVESETALKIIALFRTLINNYCQKVKCLLRMLYLVLIASFLLINLLECDIAAQWTFDGGTHTLYFIILVFHLSSFLFLFSFPILTHVIFYYTCFSSVLIPVPILIPNPHTRYILLYLFFIYPHSCSYSHSQSCLCFVLLSVHTIKIEILSSLSPVPPVSFVCELYTLFSSRY